MSSKKVPTKRNQLEVIFKAYTEGEMILGNFVPYAPQAQILQINFPESFWFDLEPFESSFIVSYQRDGLYQIFGIIEDYELKNIELPEGIEKEVYLTSNKIYVKVVEGNAIEITEKQYNHELEKIQREKNQGKALGRVRAELEYTKKNFLEFGIEEGEYQERSVQVENDLGLELYADNSDIHQKYLQEESQSILPFPPNWKRIPFCRRYLLSTYQNIPITLQGTIKYENPTLCHIPDNQCAKIPVKGHFVYIAVRAYVWLKGYWCYGIPEGQSILTIKTLIYKFLTDDEGKIQGTIWAAPPFDQGMPYIEYVDTRTSKVDIVKSNQNCSSYDYLFEETPYGLKEPNSVFYPAICQEMGEEIKCFGQTFDPVNLILNLDVLYKEEYEERTFFFQLEKNLSNVAQKWSGWGIGDTCLPLRAGYVKNWSVVCNNCGMGCQSIGYFQNNEINCDANITNRSGTYYNPSIKIGINKSLGNAMEVKWMKKLHYHETGHWLYWLMKYKNMEETKLAGLIKCSLGEITDPENEQQGALSEAFAESHIFEFLFARQTGYGTYELGEGYEIDTICENPILKKYHSDECPKCKEFCISCGENINKNPLICDLYNCDDGYEAICNDTNNSPCFSVPISAQASLLRDIYDFTNSPILDGFQDQVFLPIAQMFHCLKGKVNHVDKILPFLNIIRDTENPICISQDLHSKKNFDNLVKYYFH